MKKLLLFLLMPILMLAQNPTNFPYGIKNTAGAENANPAYLVTQEVDGVHKKTPAALFEKTENKAANFSVVNDTLYPTVKAVKNFFNSQPVSSTQSGIVNNVPLQELGGTDKTINGVRIGMGNISDIASQNTAVGSNAMASVVHTTGFTGYSNSAFGHNALKATTTGFANDAFGEGSLSSNTTGSYNSAFGTESLISNTTGSQNMAFGAHSLFVNTTGSSNTAVGLSALQQNNGSKNTAIGFKSGGGGAASITTGNSNITVGYQAGRDITTGNNNLLIENVSNASITTGSNNIVLNPKQKSGVTTGSNNTIIGCWDGAFAPALTSNVIIGNGLGAIRFQSSDTGLTTVPGQTNVLINSDATGKAVATKEWVNSVISSTTVSTLQQVLDKDRSLPSGKNFQGSLSGEGASNANYSNFFGFGAGNGAVNATNSNFFGFDSGYSATDALESNFFGSSAGDSATNASWSNFIGARAGRGATNASYSNLFGFKSGSTFSGNNLGWNNIIIGTNISLPNATANAINLGGVLFGFNTYSTTDGAPSIVATPTSRIAIGNATDNGIDRLQVNGTISALEGTSPNQVVINSQLSNKINGSGTVNTIPKFSTSNTLTDSGWKEDGGRLFNGVDDLVNGFQLTGADASINGVNIGRGKNTATTTNTVFGRIALNLITTGISNTALGLRALYNTSTGNQNTGVGRSALDTNTTGISNTGVGANSLAFNTIGQYNVGVGSFAGYWQAEGSQNTFIGNESGLRTSIGANNTLSNNSVFIGSNSKSLGVGGTNEIVIGYNASGLGTNKTVIGNSETVTTAIRGNGLFGTLVDNGIDRLQVNGTISTSPATTANQVPTLSQVQALIANPAITTVLVNNTGASLGALNANTTVNLNLNTNSIWTTNTTASKTGATVSEIIDPTTGRIKDVADKNLNTIRVVFEYSQSGGGGDGILTGQLVNPSGVVIDQESEPINVNGTAETNVRGTFRFFVVKTSDNDLGYTLRLNNGAKDLTAYRIVSVLRNNNP